MKNRLKALHKLTVGILSGRNAPVIKANDSIQQIISNTIAVMTETREHRGEWYQDMTNALQNAQQRGADWQIEVDFFTAVLDILDGRSPTLPADHPYAQAIAAIQKGIAAGGPESIDISDEMMRAIREFVNAENWEATRRVMETQQALLFRPEVEIIFGRNIEQAKAAGEEQAIRLLELHLALLRESKKRGIAETFERLTAQQEEEALPFDTELISRSLKALLGSPQEKMEQVQYLTALAAQTADEQLKALINVIQMALFGGDRSQLGQNLQGVYRQAWETIVVGVETEGVDPGVFEAIIRNTLAVLGPLADRRSEWRENLVQIRNQAKDNGTQQLVSLLDAVIGLLDRDGDPKGLGTNLTGIYGQTWQELIKGLHHGE